MTRDKLILILGSLATVLILITGWLWMSRGSADQFAGCRKSAIAGGFESIGGAFTLTDQNGQRVTDKQVLDKPSFIYFGFTYCPDVCPLDTARNAQTVSILEERGYEVTPIMISVDPKRDTPEVMRDFVQAMHPRMIGLTGSLEEIDAVAKAWRNYYRINDDEDPENYLVDHMTNTFLVMPGAGTVEFFDRGLSPEEMADRTQCFLDAAD